MEYSLNIATESILEDFMKMNYSQFGEDFRERCENAAYPHKLYTKSVRYEAWDENKLVGVICVYLNYENKFAYIPFVCVSKLYKGRGIASNLLKKIIDNCHEQFEYIGLEVREKNDAAIHLYRKFGFKSVSKTISKIQMRINLSTNCR